MKFEEWKDPYPKPVIQEIQPNVFVVRDDLIEVGSKARFIDFLIGHSEEFHDKKEIVYGSSPATGFAQISGPAVCNRYNKKFVLFMAKRDPSKYTEYQKKGIELGSIYNWVPDGMLVVTEKKAKDYVALDPKNRALLPLGLENELVLASIEKVAKGLNIEPDVVWTVGSSGTLSRGLQRAWNCEFHIVQVGHKLTEKEAGRAIIHETSYKFNSSVKKEDSPPYPSSPTYDAKLWKPFVEWKKTLKSEKKILIWNVAG